MVVNPENIALAGSAQGPLDIPQSCTTRSLCRRSIPRDDLASRLGSVPIRRKRLEHVLIAGASIRPWSSGSIPALVQAPFHISAVVSRAVAASDKAIESLRPSAPHDRGLQAQTCSSSCSYRLHLLRSWSLRQIGGESLLQYQLVQRQVGKSHEAQPLVLLLQFLHSASLVGLQATIFLAPANGMDGSLHRDASWFGEATLNVFQLHGIDRKGNAIFKRRVMRDQRCRSLPGSSHKRSSSMPAPAPFAGRANSMRSGTK